MTTAQSPIPSSFKLRSTAAEVVSDLDLSGKTAIVTGGYSGIGLETVRALAGAGAEVIVGARRVDVAKANLADIEGTISVEPLDLADPTSVDNFADGVKSRKSHLEILINNAAVMANPLSRDRRGYESQFATNHLGHFQLTARLWPLLVAARGARVVTISSSGHANNGLDLADINFEHREYNKWTAYGQAKSANALFALWLDRLGEPAGIRAFAVDPGAIATPLQRHLSMEEQVGFGWYDKAGNLNDMFKTPEQGASTTVWCAVSPELDGMGGVYCENCNIAAPWQEGNPPMVGVHPHVRDESLAKALWAKSEEMTGITFPVHSP
ncbi:MAG: oxidoreductase [bacterium]